MSAPAGPGRAELTMRLVADLGAAFQQRTAYAPEHPQVKRVVGQVLAALAACCAHAGTSEVSLILLEGQLLVDREAVPEDAPWGRGLIRAFHRHGVRGLTLVLGLDETELGLFLDGCHGAQGPTASRHVLLGQGGFAAADEGRSASAGPGTPAGAAPASVPGLLSPEHVASAGAEFRASAEGASNRIERLRGLVALLTRAEAGALGSLRPAASGVDDREFLHGLGVALATLRLGRALRVDGDALESLALAGLLHDVGYLEAADRDGDPAGRRRLHPINGAARLASLGGIPDVVVLVAYEHHLRFDGVPSYPVTSQPRTPGAASRVVAVADTWETIRSQGETRAGEALSILRGRAGTFLDPVLVDLFAAVVQPPAW